MNGPPRQRNLEHHVLLLAALLPQWQRIALRDHPRALAPRAAPEVGDQDALGVEAHAGGFRCSRRGGCRRRRCRRRRCRKRVGGSSRRHRCRRRDGAGFRRRGGVAPHRRGGGGHRRRRCGHVSSLWGRRRGVCNGRRGKKKRGMVRFTYADGISPIWVYDRTCPERCPMLHQIPAQASHKPRRYHAYASC
ncbi:hypothetical protein DFH08DRAFT_329867 [Mycena albidolilacea]|uniref:Uncharacterized protein n=1 Tax=Mycena albidolilacea TaxID=1033008 RepID=A0AAD7F1L3_9AGAR|nr:hypothetical protein DFH08DRAFT_329867 [Mycena albidolilacea]